MQAYLGQVTAAFLCSYCCNRHLCYEGGRLGRVKIGTLRVGARAKEGKRGGEEKIRRFLLVGSEVEALEVLQMFSSML